MNGNVTKEAITRDLEAMADRGFSGAMIFDAGGAEQRGNSQVPAGPTYASPAWRDLYRHALTEAHRLGLELGLSIQSGWNLGGPNVTPDYAAKQLTWSEVTLAGPTQFKQVLPPPERREAFYHDVAVLAYPLRPSVNPERMPLKDLRQKSAFDETGWSVPDCRYLLDHEASEPGEEDTHIGDMLNLTEHLAPDGTLTWEVPAGRWTVLRFGYTITDAHVSTQSAGWEGHVIDYLSTDAFDRYWDSTVEPLLQLAGPLAGTTLKQLETDSWECGGMNWSPRFDEAFKRYRGYDPIPYLPVFAGKIVDSREVSTAYLADFRKTLADCVANNHYRRFAARAHAHDMQIQPESGGPHAGPFDAIKNLAQSDILMSEFWAPSPHRRTPVDRFFVKQASSVAHTYGKRIVGAEAFTTIGPHWNDVLWRAQKPSMDHEFCSGLNMIFFHTFTCSPKEMGLPGQEYFAGTHVNPQVTWWAYSQPFVDYINRCQFLFQQGKFVADCLAYYGDHVPNLARLKEDDPAGALPGFDYDVIDEQMLTRLQVRNGRLIVPGGIQYRLLALPDHRVLSLAALEKVEAIVQAGGTVLGVKPQRLVSLVGGPESQTRFHTIADTLWGANPEASGSRQIGIGHLIWGRSAREVLLDRGVLPDVEFDGGSAEGAFDWIHYSLGANDLYFVCNQSEQTETINVRFRIQEKTPQLWDPVTGNVEKTVAFAQSGGRTTVPLRMGPNQSMFVLFNDTVPAQGTDEGVQNYHDYTTVQTIQGPWQVHFDPKWGGPASIEFETLTDWSQHSDEGIRFYSGTARYRKRFTQEGANGSARYWLDLGEIKDVGIAQVWLNGREVATLWTKPFRVEVTEQLKAGINDLEIHVVNSWRNRLIGDRDLPPEQRRTNTNIRVRRDWQLEPSGLLGPVRLLTG